MCFQKPSKALKGPSVLKNVNAWQKTGYKKRIITFGLSRESLPHSNPEKIFGIIQTNSHSGDSGI